MKVAHWNLHSFLHYLQTNPPSTSATFQGTLYEYSVQHVLESVMGMSLTRCGKPGDTGVDLMGDWYQQQLSVIVQCKSSMKKVNGRIFRELEGVHSYHFDNTKEEGRALMIAAAPMPMTQQGMAQFEGTRTPMMFCQVDRLTAVYDRKLGVYNSEPFDRALRSSTTNLAAKELLKRAGASVKDFGLS